MQAKDAGDGYPRFSRVKMSTQKSLLSSERWWFDEGSGSLLLIVGRCEVTVTLEVHILVKVFEKTSWTRIHPLGSALEPLSSAVNRLTSFLCSPMTISHGQGQKTGWRIGCGAVRLGTFMEATAWRLSPVRKLTPRCISGVRPGPSELTFKCHHHHYTDEPTNYRRQ